jgi:hypothetical protein
LNSLDLLATSGGILLLFEVFLFVYGIEERRRRRAEKERKKEPVLVVVVQIYVHLASEVLAMTRPCVSFTSTSLVQLSILLACLYGHVTGNDEYKRERERTNRREMGTERNEKTMEKKQQDILPG